MPLALADVTRAESKSTKIKPNSLHIRVTLGRIDLPLRNPVFKIEVVFYITKLQFWQKCISVSLNEKICNRWCVT